MLVSRLHASGLRPDYSSCASAPVQLNSPQTLAKSVCQRDTCRARATAAKEYTVEESKTYMDETFWIERPAGPRRSFDKAVLDRAGDAPEGAHLLNMNHYSMEVFDNNLIRDFYFKVLGFKQVNRPRFPFDGTWLRAPGVFIHLIIADPTVPRSSDHWKDSYEVAEPEPWYIRRGHHHAFAVNDIEAMEKRLKHFSVEYAKFTVPDTNAAQIFLFDPEGNGIELGSAYEEIAESLQKKGLYTPE